MFPFDKYRDFYIPIVWEPMEYIAVYQSISLQNLLQLQRRVARIVLNAR
jgi:hypothetical protein